jgi:hypothetical protein
MDKSSLYKFEMGQIPGLEALRFGAHTHTKFMLGEGENKPRKFSGIGYTGDVIPGHWYWGNVIFALDSIETIGKIPALIDHNRSLRAGFVDSAVINDATGVTFTGPLLNNDAGNQVASESDQGFPWQMSLHIEPSSIEQVDPGTNVVVNGRSLVGPLTIFRNSKVIEVSFTATGQDSNTSAQAFSKGAHPIQINGETPMTPEQIKALQDRAAALETENTQFKKQAADLQVSLDAALKTAADAEANRRKGELETLFSAAKRELSADKLTAYQAMPTAMFSVVFADLKESIKPVAKPGMRTDLFSHTKPPAESPAEQESQSTGESSGIAAAAKRRFAKA